MAPTRGLRKINNLEVREYVTGTEWSGHATESPCGGLDTTATAGGCQSLEMIVVSESNEIPTIPVAWANSTPETP
jgi:hypothetical protein